MQIPGQVKCLDLAKSVTPKTAQVIRVQFDVLRWLASKFHPAAYAEKPAPAPSQTVNVGIAISPQRLSELRAKLDQTRAALQSPKTSSAQKTS